VGVGREISPQAEDTADAAVVGLSEEATHRLRNRCRIDCDIKKSVAVPRSPGLDALGAEAGGDEDVAVGLKVQLHHTGRYIHQRGRGRVVEGGGSRQGSRQLQPAGVGGAESDPEQCRVQGTDGFGAVVCPMLQGDGVGTFTKIFCESLEHDRPQVIRPAQVTVQLIDPDRRPIDLKPPIGAPGAGTAQRFPVQGAGDQDLPRDVKGHGTAQTGHIFEGGIARRVPHRSKNTRAVNETRRSVLDRQIVGHHVGVPGGDLGIGCPVGLLSEADGMVPGTDILEYVDNSRKSLILGPAKISAQGLA